MGLAKAKQAMNNEADDKNDSKLGTSGDFEQALIYKNFMINSIFLKISRTTEYRKFPKIYPKDEFLRGEDDVIKGAPGKPKVFWGRGGHDGALE